MTRKSRQFQISAAYFREYTEAWHENLRVQKSREFKLNAAYFREYTVIMFNLLAVQLL